MPIRAPRGVLSTRGARHPAASACDIQARAGCLPGAPTSKVQEPPPPPCPRVSQPPCSPHDPADSRCPRPPGPPTSVQCRPVFSAAHANTATLSSPCSPLALPRDSPSRRTQGRARRAGRPAPQPGPCSSGPGPRPLTALDSKHGQPLTGLPGLCTGPRHSQQRPLPAVAPRPPRCSALPSLPRRPAWGSLGPRPRPSHETRDRTPPQMLCVQPVDFGTCLPPGLQARQGLAGSLWSPCAPRTQSSVR